MTQFDNRTSLRQQNLMQRSDKHPQQEWRKAEKALERAKVPRTVVDDFVSFGRVMGPIVGQGPVVGQSLFVQTLGSTDDAMAELSSILLFSDIHLNQLDSF